MKGYELLGIGKEYQRNAHAKRIIEEILKKLIDMIERVEHEKKQNHIFLIKRALRMEFLAHIMKKRWLD